MNVSSKPIRFLILTIIMLITSLIGTPPRNTISHYLRQDVPSLEAQEEVARKKIKRPSPRNLSLDAHTTIKLEKLEGVIFIISHH